MMRSAFARSLFSLGRSGLTLALAGLLPILGAAACSSDSSSSNGDGAVTTTGDGGVTPTGDGGKTGDALGTSSLGTPDGPGPIVGACEMQMANLYIRTADGTASIASATPTGCTLSMQGCVPGEAGDGGAAAACSQITLLAGTAGTCSVALTSTTGQHATVSAMLNSKPSGLRCTGADGKVVDVPTLSFEPSFISASFGADGGM
jgi:hypothetical protein